jgi:hypothetical protein
MKPSRTGIMICGRKRAFAMKGAATQVPGLAMKTGQ